MIPAWTITADGTDVSARLADYLLTLRVTDRAGMESDDLELTVADPRAEIALPRLGAVLAVSLGYKSSGLVAMGSYTVDTVELSNPPRQMQIRGHAAELSGGLKTRKTRGWDATTVGQIVQTIAGEHGLTAAVDQDLASVAVARIDQTNESDPSFLTRLGQEHDAILSIKAGRLLFARRGQATTVSGTEIPAIALAPADVISWRLAITEAGKYTAVEARHYTRETASEEWVRAGEGDGDAVLRLRQTYPDRARAQAAADSRLAALARGQSSASITMPGNPVIAAETPLVLAGFDPVLDGRWIATTVAHTLDSGGLRTEIDAESAEAVSAVEQQQQQ